jgi:hypothetical protein
MAREANLVKQHRSSVFAGRTWINSSHCEVAMSARRREPRLEMINAEGVLRVVRDVLVRRSDGDEFTVISDVAARKGEVLTIYVASHGNSPVAVRVADSQPRIVDGAVRHELRLTRLDAGASGPVGTSGRGQVEAE